MLVSVFTKRRDMRVVIYNVGLLIFEKADDVERRTFSHVVDVALVGDAEDKNAAAIHWLAIGIEGLRDALYDERRHLTVDLAREIDEARLVVERAHLPREIMRIEWNTVSANSGARRELHEAERLRRRGIDDFPDVDTELVADDLHLVHEPDVDRPERVLEQLHQLRRLCARNRNNLFEARRIECRSDFGACRC